MRDTIVRSFLCSIAAAALVVAAAAQPQATPPQRQGDGETSLEDTMKFIQDTLNGVEPINFVVSSHAEVTGEDRTTQWRYEISKVEAHPDSCVVAYHQKKTLNGKVSDDRDRVIALKTVKNIDVMSEDQYWKILNSSTGHPAMTTRENPRVFMVWVNKSDGANYLYFFDKDLARRVSEDMVHAVNLCGGGKPEPAWGMQ
jgi:hypothetical protein